ncbi:MAG: tetraacyldisaccharide 4'-kinase [Armatimonadota bacterium]
MNPSPPADSSLERSWRAVVGGETPLSVLAVPVLWLTSLPYSCVIRASHELYAAGIMRQTTTPLPVVSVGNISLGGTGKTTVTQFLAEKLGEMGLKTGIVLRGYKRRGRGPLMVSDGETLNATAEDAGDEAWMLASTLPESPVAVATRRERAVEMLRRQTDVSMVLLDDGFQYYRMAREIDLVLLDACRAAGSDRLFPAGYLREPYTHLSRATDVWITHADLADEESVERCRRIAEKYAPHAPVVTTSHALERCTDWWGNEVPVENLRTEKCAAVAGLGNPESFFAMVKHLLDTDIQYIAFDDHHQYREGDWEMIRGEFTDDMTVITTPKDAVKMPDPPEYLNVHILHPTIKVEAGFDACEDLLMRARSVAAANE